MKKEDCLNTSKNFLLSIVIPLTKQFPEIKITIPLGKIIKLSAWKINEIILFYYIPKLRNLHIIENKTFDT